VQAADVELVEAELVKQEKMEEAEEEVQEEVQLIRADGESRVSGGLFQWPIATELCVSVANSSRALCLSSQ